MGNPERQSSPEIPTLQFDAIVVLGENIKRGWSPKEIREDKYHLSPYSKANVLAATILYLKGITNSLIFSTGHTAGKNVPSEAQAMENYFKTILEQRRRAEKENPFLNSQLYMPPFSIIKEERSLTTSANAREVKRFLKEYHPGVDERVALLVPGFHAQRADYHFKRQGLNLKILKTEDILQQVLPGIKDKFMTPDMVALELNREKVIATIEKLPLGTFITGSLSRLTRR